MNLKIKISKNIWMSIHLLLIATAGWIIAGMIDSKAADIFKTGSSNLIINQSSEIQFLPRSGSADISAIVRGNIFNSKLRGEEPTSEENGMSKDSPTGGAVKSSIGAKLLGTMINESANFAIAVVEIDGKEQIIGKNDTLLGSKVLKVERNALFIEHNGKTEVLKVNFADWEAKTESTGKNGAFSPSGTPMADVVKISENDYSLSRRYVDSEVANMGKLITQVRAVPNIGPGGKTNGFRLFSIKPGSLFSRIGLKNRDVIKKINGVNIDSAEKGLELFQALRSESSFDVDIERNNSKNTLKYQIQ